MDTWLQDNLACPRTGEPLTRKGDVLRSPSGSGYSVVEDVPILLRDAVPRTLGFAHTSVKLAGAACNRRLPADRCLFTLGISDEEPTLARRLGAEHGAGVGLVWKGIVYLGAPRP